MKFRFLLLTLASLSYCTTAMAATYYVDAINGNDNWSGTTSSITAPNGAWQSIAKVNATVFKPGDQVLFSCGHVWYETLKPNANGTASAKIYFGSYPSQCSNKPKISGMRSVPSNNWQPYKGNIWKTTFPQNLIANGSLSQSVANWTKWPSDASQTFNTTCPISVAGCMNFIAGSSANTSLAISRTFSIIGGKKYTATVSIYAPSGISAKLIVREHGNSWRTLGLANTIDGNNAWQDVTVDFTATQTLTNARLDIEVPKTKQIYIRYVSVQEKGVLASPSMVIFNGDPITVAHHPNAGHDSNNPDSVYFKTTAVSPVVLSSYNTKVNSQIFTPDLKVPSGGSIGPGTKLRLRTVNWRIDDFSVSSVGTGSLSITPSTIYAMPLAGWGFYFYDALWMLDSASEWFFDEKTQTLYLWSPNNEHPGNSVAIATLSYGINLGSKSNLVVENLEIDGASTGITIQNSSDVTLQSLYIHNIKGHAIFARSSANATISANRINKVATIGFAAINAYNSTNALIDNNELSEAGVIVKSGKRVSLPMTTEYTIYGGNGTIITNNTLSDIGSFGIYGESNNEIDSNTIQNACVNLNDCSAVYVADKSLGTAIRNNLILDTSADLTGTPDSMWTISNGIYLDHGISGISVTGNTVKGGVSSLHLHNSKQTSISGNIFYGATGLLLRQQEDDITKGRMSGNVVTGNQFFPTVNNVAIHNTFSSVYSPDASKFATYDNNKYSTIYSPHITRESNIIGLSNAYTLPEWQDADNSVGQPRNNDLQSVTTAPLPSFAQGTAGANSAVNGNFSAGLEGWGSWNAIEPISSRNLEGCLPVSVNCMHVIAGGSTTLVNTPSFKVTKDKYYRITFDIKTTATNANLSSQVEFAGPDNFKALMKTVYKFIAPTDWERHSFVFQATATSSLTIVNQGARFDIQGLPSNKHLWIANFEIAPYDPGFLGPTRTDLLANKTDEDKSMDCPVQSSDPNLCSHYFIFPEATPATWPVTVPPRKGRIVFTQNITLLDSDRDGIADSQDQCAGTAEGLAVNGKGCSLLD